MKSKIIPLLVIFLLAITSCNQDNKMVKNTSTDNGTANDIPNKNYSNFGGISKEQCIEAKGHWNECESPCVGTNAEVCIEMCLAQCECGGIAGFGCPKGYICKLSGKIMDEMGICVKE